MTIRFKESWNIDFLYSFDGDQLELALLESFDEAYILSIKRLCRILTNSHNSMPVTITTNSTRPKITGEKWHYTNKSGELIRYPSAYKWRKYYHPSTTSIEIGEKWLRKKKVRRALSICRDPRCFGPIERKLIEGLCS